MKTHDKVFILFYLFISIPTRFLIDISRGYLHTRCLNMVFYCVKHMKTKKAARVYFVSPCMCSGQESNLHVETDTTS